MKKGQVLMVECENCHGKRNHVVLAVDHDTGPSPEYSVAVFNALIKCRGCEEVSFLREVHDYEVTYQVSETEWEHEVYREKYPQVFEGYYRNEVLSDAPEIVRKVYSETVNSIKSKSRILAGAGLRATIEAICNDKGIVAKDLKARINKMAAMGIVAKDDALRLQGIRFLGNDAVHDIRPARREALLIALKIIDHIIETLYGLDDAEAYLDLPIEGYGEFRDLLKVKIRKMEVGNLFTLAGILGKDIRRIEDPEAMETMLEAEIAQENELGIKMDPNRDQRGKRRYLKQ